MSRSVTHWGHMPFRAMEEVESWAPALGWVRDHDRRTRAACGAFGGGTHVIGEVTCKSCLKQYHRMAQQAEVRRISANLGRWIAARQSRPGAYTSGPRRAK